MIDSGVIMRRAVRWVMETNDLKPDSLGLMDHVTQSHFKDLAIAVADDMVYNQIKYFRPLRPQF